jgi:hypothetical protein
MMRRLERLSIGSLTLLLSILLLLIGVQPAAAHDDNNYWEVEWRSQDRGTSKQDYEFTNQVPGDSNGSFADSVARGSQAWNAIAINGADMHFRRNGAVANYNPFTPCDLADYRNGIHYRDIPDNPLARALMCFTPGTNNWVDNFQVVFDPDYSWYKGVDYTGIGGSQYDVDGTSTHEFGHVVGGWTDGSVEGHYDPTNNATLCGSGVSIYDQHTMCVSTGPGLQASLRRSLETHDIDVFVLAYA